MASSIITRLAGAFPRPAVERGRSYFWERRVRVIFSAADEVRAEVVGSRPYQVALYRHGDALAVECTCAHYTGNLEPCKHVVATVFVAEHERLEAVAGHVARVDVVDPELEEEPYEDEGDEPRELVYELDEREYAELKSARERYDRLTGRTRRTVPRRPSWRARLDAVAERIRRESESGEWPESRQLVYVLDVGGAREGRGLALELLARDRRAGGEWGAPKPRALQIGMLPKLADPADRLIIAQLVGGLKEYEVYGYSMGYSSVATSYRLPPYLAGALVPELCATGRCQLRPAAPDRPAVTLEWDDGPPWEFWAELRHTGKHGAYVMTGSLRRGDVSRPVAEPLAVFEGGLVFDEGRVARLDDRGAFALLAVIRDTGEVSIVEQEVEDFLARLLELPAAVRLDLPDELRFEEVRVAPTPRLMIRSPAGEGGGSDRLRCELTFDYAGAVVPPAASPRVLFDRDGRRLVARDAAAEAAAAARLGELGLKAPPPHAYGSPWLLAPKRLPRVARDLAADGWYVEAEGKLYRKPGEFRIQVTSGLDWFDLHGEVDFGGVTASLPELLAALRRGESTVRLGDGTFGLLPEEWLERHGLLAAVATTEDDRLRFRRSQIGMLDALLASQPEADVDEIFERARAELRRFDGVKPAEAPPGFEGELRGYQREGLGWMGFLRDFGFGGCLADDMGLGKTVQVLALLEDRRAGGGGRAPRTSLVVVPRSLVFNWKLEAERFTPELRLLDHTGPDRARDASVFPRYDLVLTTYGTLRRDAAMLREVDFDYVVLDEAQAIKNADTESAKAARLLRGEHRLALSGTPVENHLGELWSLFEFLNPGLLGAAPAFKAIAAAGGEASGEGRELLARAVRPFILRRTKEQVAKELPPKTEQTIYCELDTKQRKLYDELRAHYRAALLGRIERQGLKRSKIQVLEALLRLRQAACHPGLIDAARAGQPSAKLDALLEHLAEVLEEGHKALVFSQFTSLLALVRDRLDAMGVVYEYLDGRTRDRAARVRRFQDDPGCGLFLISLKAGGLGLNLTAAEYVFLLDPWWNPAVEAQAIDRAHRIGQTRSVFAYRLIARDTVEEKVLELQASKRELADAIIRADEGLIRNLTGDDLALLLS